MKPVLVGVSGSIRMRDGAERASVNAAYVRSVANAGGLPVILTPAIEAVHAAQVIRPLDALLLTGGHDVDPSLYRSPASKKLGPLDRPRDDFEIALFRAARARQIPVLGVCRGLQVINVAMGGTLWQDLPSENPGAIEHEKEGAARNARIHSVRVDPASRLSKVMQVSHMVTNSFHHQAIRSLAPGLSAVAWADDTVIEGVECDAAGGWLLAVQWHPEEFFEEPASPDQRLFAALITAAREAARGEPVTMGGSPIHADQ